ISYDDRTDNVNGYESDYFEAIGTQEKVGGRHGGAVSQGDVCADSCRVESNRGPNRLCQGGSRAGASAARSGIEAAEEAMTRREFYDWPPEGNWPPRSRLRPEIIDYERDRRGTFVPRRQRRPLSFINAFIIVAVAAIVVLRFTWAPILMGFILVG